MPDVHAKLSASGSHIWLHCTPSVKLSEGIPDKDTIFSREGTLAHALAEATLQRRFGRITEDFYQENLQGIKALPLYNAEMQAAIDKYCDWVEEIYNGIKAADKELLTEQRLDFSEWVPDGFGTGDVVIIADGVLTVIDLKYGKGVPVSAVENPQLMLYGLGAYDSFSLSNDFEKVRMIINQPRLDSITEYTLDVSDLLRWADEYVRPRADMAMRGAGEAVPGDHCRFCKVRAICRDRAEYALSLAKMDFKDPGLLTDDEIGEVLQKAAQVASWASDVKEYAQAEAEHGKQFKGWKLVEGRSVRKFTDLPQVSDRLQKAGFEKAVIYKEPELLGISALEKVVGGKKKLEALLEGLIIKPQGAPTLVPETDKRPALDILSKAKDDFNNEEE